MGTWPKRRVLLVRIRDRVGTIILQMNKQVLPGRRLLPVGGSSPEEGCSPVGGCSPEGGYSHERGCSPEGGCRQEQGQSSCGKEEAASSKLAQEGAPPSQRPGEGPQNLQGDPGRDNGTGSQCRERREGEKEEHHEGRGWWQLQDNGQELRERWQRERELGAEEREGLQGREGLKVSQWLS